MNLDDAQLELVIFDAGSETDRLASYRVNGETGELTPLDVDFVAVCDAVLMA